MQYRIIIKNSSDGSHHESDRGFLTSAPGPCDDAHMSLLELHVGSEGRMRHPLSRVTWVRLFQHPVDLFQRQSLGLRDKEVDEGEAKTAKTAPHADVGTEVGLASAGADEVLGNDGNDLKGS